MLRTSITLPVPLHQKLLLAAKAENKSLSDLVRDILQEAVNQPDQRKLNQIYAALAKAKGICKEPIYDASTTINEILYGNNGAWKGENDK